MNVQPRSTAEETRARIVTAAEGLFRRLGFAKTAVADIAGELGMSPANVYRFFPSKHAIVEAICQRCLAELDESAWSVARSRGTAGARAERLFLEILEYHKDNFITEKRVHDIVLIAIEQNWAAIQGHKQTVLTTLELILRDGIESGEFDPVDPKETARIMLGSMVCFCHPLLVAQKLAEGEDLDADASATVRFLLRAIVKRD